MSAANIPFYLDQVIRHRLSTVEDPGAGGEILIENNGDAICICRTATAESRTFEDADHFGVGQKLTVVLDVHGGDLTLPGAVVLNAAGSAATFIVTVIDGVHAWAQIADSVVPVPYTLVPADTSGVGTILETPTEQNLADIIKALSVALEDAGFITDVITQAS